MREAGPRQDAFDISFSLKDVLDMSPSSFTLKEVLDRAPGLGSDGDQYVDVVQHWPSGDKHAHWTNPYYTEVFQALIGVIREHGITGWKDARWTVHDAVSGSGSSYPLTTRLRIYLPSTTSQWGWSECKKVYMAPPGLKTMDVVGFKSA